MEETVKCLRDGVQDAVLIELDPRSYLEIADSKHRYSKNLRLYFQEYARIKELNRRDDEVIPSNNDRYGDDVGGTKWSRFNSFFTWLDTPDESNQLVQLPLCPRSTLDTDTVLYLTEEEDILSYAYYIDQGLMRKHTEPEKLLDTTNDGWIFVMKNGLFYCHVKDTKSRPRFQHTTFLSGNAVEAAGLIVCVNGVITKLFPHSGHYRPKENHLRYMLEFLVLQGIDLRTVKVDAQRVIKIARQHNEGVKVKKSECAYLMDGHSLIEFLRSKAKMTSVLDMLALKQPLASIKRGGNSKSNRVVHSVASDLHVSPIKHVLRTPESATMQRARVLSNIMYSSGASTPSTASGGGNRSGVSAAVYSNESSSLFDDNEDDINNDAIFDDNVFECGALQVPSPTFDISVQMMLAESPSMQELLYGSANSGNNTTRSRSNSKQSPQQPIRRVLSSPHTHSVMLTPTIL